MLCPAPLMEINPVSGLPVRPSTRIMTKLNRVWFRSQPDVRYLIKIEKLRHKPHVKTKRYTSSPLYSYRNKWVDQAYLATSPCFLHGLLEKVRARPVLLNMWTSTRPISRWQTACSRRLIDSLRPKRARHWRPGKNLRREYCRQHARAIWVFKK